MGNFKKVKNCIALEINVNITIKEDHVGETERNIRHPKDRGCCITAYSKYRYLHALLINHLVKFVVMLMNSFPDKECPTKYHQEGLSSDGS